VKEQSEVADADGDPMIRLNDIEKMLNVSKRTVFRLLADGDFPVPFRISANVLRWRRSAILNWLETRQAPQGDTDHV